MRTMFTLLRAADIATTAAATGGGVLRRFCLRSLLLLFLVTISLFPASALAGQTIDINSDTNQNVYGNGNSTSGYAPTQDQINSLINPTDNNSVTINANVNSGSGDVYGGAKFDNAATVSNNSVTVSSGSMRNVYGGHATSMSYMQTDHGATATNNKVIINDGTIDTVIGGDASTGGTSGVRTNASGNSVIINGGAVTNVYGGQGEMEAVVSGNSVTINGGTVTGMIAGGNLVASFQFTSINNTVTLTGSPDLSGASIYGTLTSSMATDLFTGNRLNVHNYSGTGSTGSTGTIDNIQNFQYFNFLLPANAANGDTVLTADNVTLGNGQGTGSTIERVDFETGGRTQQAGDKFTLIDASASPNDLGDLTNDGQSLLGRKGAILYEIEIAKTVNNTITATITGNPRVNPQVPEAALSVLSLGILSADLVAGQGMEDAVRAARARNRKFAIFTGVSGGKVRYNTGSHVDISGLSLMAGLAKGIGVSWGRVTLGAFFEYGNGSYDTYNSFANTSLEGSGKASHMGGGLLGRAETGRFYLEASARVGNAKNEYDSELAEYDSSGMYYGAHLGGGYIFRPVTQGRLDLYGRYFWTRWQGDKVTLSTGEKVELKDADSHRLKAGGRFSYAVKRVAPYIGAAYEYELDGEAKAETSGVDTLDAPSLKGGTGIGELGISITPQTLPLLIDLGVQGHMGKREGITGSLQVKAEF